VGGWVRDALLGVLRWGERGVTLGNNEFMGIGGDRKERERERERERWEEIRWGYNSFGIRCLLYDMWVGDKTYDSLNCIISLNILWIMLFYLFYCVKKIQG
jgi:hypothetical protein